MKRIVFFILGIIFALLGVIGVILPVMPGVIFFVAAAYFFSHSSQTLHMALFKIPVIGPSISEWESTRKMSPKLKLAIGSLFLTMAIYPWFLYENKASAIIMTNIFIISLLYLISIESKD